jgi:hypothetical protein
MIGDNQYGVTNGHGSALLAPTGGESALLSPEVSVPPTTSGMRRLHEGRPQPGIALAGLATSAFASTLVITRTHSSPGGQMMFGFTALVTTDLCCSDQLLPEDSRSWLRAQLNHFHHMVVARRAMKN